LIWEIIYILVAAISHKRSVSSLGYDIALAALLAIGVGQWHTKRKLAAALRQAQFISEFQLLSPQQNKATSKMQ